MIVCRHEFRRSELWRGTVRAGGNTPSSRTYSSSYDLAMPSSSEAPKLSQYACVVDRSAVDLTAVLSSYLFASESYLPVFLFPKIDVPRADDPAFMSEDYVAMLMAKQIPSAWVGVSGRVKGGESPFPHPSGVSKFRRRTGTNPDPLKVFH